MRNKFTRVISASLSPNAKKDDVLLALRSLLRPWAWKKGSYASLLSRWFERIYSGYTAVPFNSGRSALYALLRAFGIGKGDEVLVQAFTCVAVPNSVLWTGATPVYVDIDPTLNIDINDAKKKLSKRTKAIIVQHTFGIPADMDTIRTFAQKFNLLIIEDCAHALGATSNGMPVGAKSDGAFFSFGRDKVLSSVFGGMAIIAKKHAAAIADLQKFQTGLAIPSYVWIFQQLIHPVAFAIILPLYRSGVGKILLKVLQSLRILTFPVYQEEKCGIRMPVFPAKYPDILAALALHQTTKLDAYNQIRSRSARLYKELLRTSDGIRHVANRPGSIFLRYPILVDDPVTLRQRAKRHGILLGNWYSSVIDPAGVHMDTIGYVMGSCPNAERVSKHIVNLPTLLTPEERRIVVSELRS